MINVIETNVRETNVRVTNITETNVRVTNIRVTNVRETNIRLGHKVPTLLFDWQANTPHPATSNLFLIDIDHENNDFRITISIMKKRPRGLLL